MGRLCRGAAILAFWSLFFGVTQATEQVTAKITAVTAITAAACPEAADKAALERDLSEKIEQLLAQFPSDPPLRKPTSKPPAPKKSVSPQKTLKSLGFGNDVSIRPVGKGGFKAGFQLVPADPLAEAVFPDAEHIPPELRGKSVEDFVMKVVLPERAEEPAQLLISQKRDKDIYGGIRDVLAEDAERGRGRYTGIEIEETYFIRDPETGEEIVLQKFTQGQTFDSQLKEFFHDLFEKYDKTTGRELFRVLLKERKGLPTFVKLGKSSIPLTEIWSNPEKMKKLEELLKSPAFQEFEDLMRKLEKLNESEKLFELGAPFRATLPPGIITASRMPWSRPTIGIDSMVRGLDSSINNFRLYRGPDGKLRLRLFDW